MGSTPNLSASYDRRFRVDPITARAVEVETRPLGDLYNEPVTNRAMFTLKRVSDVGKLDEVGNPERGFKYKLPPMALTHLIISALHPTGGVQPREGGFPYSMRALGPVDVKKILRGGRGLVSDEFVIVP